MFNAGDQTILALETAIDGGSISVLRSGRQIASVAGESGLSKSEDILPIIEELLEKNGIGKREIGLIAVSDGPGSLTGVRIGLSIARGLGDSLSAEVFRISVLEALTHRVDFEGRVWSALYSPRGGVFFREFLIKDEKRVPLGEIVQIPKPFDFVQNLESTRKEELAIILPTDFMTLLAEYLNNAIDLENIKFLPVKGNLAETIGLAASNVRLIMNR